MNRKACCDCFPPLDPGQHRSYANVCRPSGLERPHTQQQGNRSELEHEGQYQQGDQKYQDESRRDHLEYDQQQGVQQCVVCSRQEIDKTQAQDRGQIASGNNQLQHSTNSSFTNKSQQPSTKASKHSRQKTACGQKENRSNRCRSASLNSKGGMTANSYENRSSLLSAYNMGSNTPTDRQPPQLHMAPFSPSIPTSPYGTPAPPHPGIMAMTGGKDGASNIVPRKPSLDGFDGGLPQNQVTKKKTVSGETNSSGRSSFPSGCQGHTLGTTENEHGSPQATTPFKNIQHDYLHTGSGPSTESETSIHCNCSEHTSSCPERELVKGTESNPQDKTILEKIVGVFTSPGGGTDYKRLYDQERKKYDKEKNKYEEEKKKYEQEKSKNQQMLQQCKYDQAQYERNKEALEQALESVKILYQEEKKKSESLRKMVLEKREGGFSTTEPPYDEISTKYEGLFGAMAKAVVDSCRPPNATREEKKAHKREWMKYLCHSFQILYEENKKFLIDQAFVEIFTPRRTLKPGYDPDQSKMEVDVYGHLVEVFFKKHQANQPPGEDYVFKMVSECQKTAAKNSELHVEVGGSIQLERFVIEAVRVCLDMLTVNPPMLLDTSETIKNEDTQRVQLYGVSKGMEDAVEDDAAEFNVEFFKPVLYKNYLRDIPTQKGWTGVVTHF